MNYLNQLSVRQRVFLILLVISIFFLTFLAIDVGPRNFHWADRDLTRAVNLAHVFQISGAEYTFTGRTPGGAYYYILWLFLLISSDAYIIYIVYLVFLFAAIVYVADWVGQAFSGRVAVFFIIALLGNYTVLANLGMLWNPMIGFPFMLVSLLFTWRMVAERNGLFIIPAAALAAVAIQCHLSFVYLLPIAIVSSLTTRIDYRWIGYGLGILCVVAAFSPYLVYEVQHDFPIYKEAVFNKAVQQVSIIATPINLPGVFDENDATFRRFIVSIESLKYMLSVPFGILFESPGGVLPEGISAQLHKFAQATLASGGILIASIIYGVWLIRLRLFHWHSDGISNGNRLSVVLLLSLLLITMLMSWTNVGITPRYLLFVVVCGALFGAVAVSFLWDLSWARRSVLWRAIVLSFVLWCAVGIGQNIVTASETLHSTPGITSLAVRESLRRGIEQFTNARGFEPSGIAVLYGDGRRTGKKAAYFIGEVNSYFFGDLAKRRFSADKDRHCIAVVADAKSDMVIDRKRFADLANELTGLGSKIQWGDTQLIGKHFIASYVLPHGNCLDTARNYWIYDTKHMESFEASQKLGSAAVEVAVGKNIRRFIFKIDRFGQYRVVLDIIGEGQGFRTILRSYGLQNQYFGQAGIIKPMLNFQLVSDPNSHFLKMAPDVPVGTITPGLETPVRSGLAPYRLDQLRRITFIAEEIVGVENTPLLGPLEIILTEGKW
jgi:hypothetical protein